MISLLVFSFLFRTFELMNTSPCSISLDAISTSPILLEHSEMFVNSDGQELFENSDSADQENNEKDEQNVFENKNVDEQEMFENNKIDDEKMFENHIVAEQELFENSKIDNEEELFENHKVDGQVIFKDHESIKSASSFIGVPPKARSADPLSGGRCYCFITANGFDDVKGDNVTSYSRSRDQFWNGRSLDRLSRDARQASRSRYSRHISPSPPSGKQHHI